MEKKNIVQNIARVVLDIADQQKEILKILKDNKKEKDAKK